MINKNYTDVYIGLLFILLSNTLVVYGVVCLNWNFFTVIYAYWFGELISSVFDTIKISTLKHRNELPIFKEKKEVNGRFFFLFLYWIFIVIIVGFITAPDKTYGDNIMVIFFLNKIFNINLLLVLLGELVLYLNVFFIVKKYNPETIVAQNSLLNKKTLILHMSIIFGTFSWFAMNTDKFFFHIDLGEYGNYGFMFVFVTIRIIGDLIGLKTSIKTNTR